MKKIVKALFWGQTFMVVTFIVFRLITVGMVSAKAISPDDIDYANSIVYMINEERKSKGVEPLLYDTRMQEAADIRAKEASSKWSHTRPDGTEYWTVNEDLVYGENLGKGSVNLNRMFKAWKDSPTHYANIVDPGLKTIAISFYRDPLFEDYYWVSCEFGIYPPTP